MIDCVQVVYLLMLEKSNLLYLDPPRYRTGEQLSLKLHHSKLFESSKIQYLGIILDNKLDWKGHITELSKKLSCAL